MALRGRLDTTGNPSRRRAALLVVVACLVALVALGGYTLATRSSAESGELYFTTYVRSGLYKVSFSFSGGRPHFGSGHLVTKLPHADGVAFEPDGRAIVGGQNTGKVEEVDPGSGAFSAVPSGCPGAFLITVDPAGTAAYTAGLPGPLCKFPVDPLGTGARQTLSGDDPSVTGIAFNRSGQAFYTTGEAPGPGNFGLLNVSTGATSRQLTQIAAGHGITFDTYTGTLILFGGGTIMQIDPRHPQQILSTMSVPGLQFDQGTTDGEGHIFAASNFGQLVVVDDRVSGRLGDPRNTVTKVFLHNNLDDIAPLVGPGAAATSRRTWIGVTAAALGVLGVGALLALLGVPLRPGSNLPSWDVRRQEEQRRQRAAVRRRPRPPAR